LTAGREAPAKPRRFRSPFAVAAWWLWALFAIGNLIDLAVQGRDHLSVVAVFILLFVTGVMYTAALRPRILADADGLTIVNPLRDHRVVWAAVAGVDSTELVRVRCEWPLAGAPAVPSAPSAPSAPAAADAGADGGGPPGAADVGGAASAVGADAKTTGKRAIYCWAVHSSRRRQLAAQLRAERQSKRRGAGRGFGGFGGFGAPEGPPPPSPAAEAEQVVATLTALAERAKVADPDQRAVPPVSRWYWPAFAVIIGLAIALVIAILA
jgi:Bacterial PH domain